MPRRLHINHLSTGLVELDERQSHHARQVLRLEIGQAVEIFDDAGRSAEGTIENRTGRMTIRVVALHDVPPTNFTYAVAAALPKGERADWMIEKLSELGCQTFVPLIADRSVVVPKGTSKLDRWTRIATESAKQCRRRGVMRIEEPTELILVLSDLAARKHSGKPAVGWFMDLNESAVNLRELLLTPPSMRALTLLVGPEGGWTQHEVDLMLDSHLTGVRMTNTVLRVETAAVASAACVAGMWAESSNQ